MFKIESYVTPILLSYVDKYVRDFKPADAQVSLWGGGVALHNLVLKADVLQQEVSLPFTLVSGRIHELLIQVPWTKIMSEPIIVTIDTIECVLSLYPPTSPDGSPPPESPSRKSPVVEAPPGYMQALVRRIVSNIALRVHHLIVKYVQDDIVLSLNVKHLAVDSAGTNWEAAFADIDQAEPVIRRLVRLDDLTLCLDRADSDGKIRYYQEPLLYRCQLDFRVLTRLVSANTRRASSLTVQLRSTKLAFGVTSEQLVLLLRLLRERPVVEQKQPPPPTNKTNAAATPLHVTSSNSAEPARQESWSEWAWSWLPTWMDREGGVEEAPITATPTPIHFTAYLDDISLVYKVMELESGSRKRARGVLELIASYAAIKSYICSPTSFRARVGARLLTLCSHGKCTCGHLDLCTLNNKPTVYLCKLESLKSGETMENIEESWKWPEEDFTHHKVETAQVINEEYRESPEVIASQADCEVDQPDIGPEIPDQGPQQPSDTIDELWLKMDPVVYFEYIHDRSPPDRYANPYDNPPIEFEYSDWVEVCNVKVNIEPMELRVGMDLLHRINAVKSALDELPPVPVLDLPMRTLTVEENEALSENLPQRSITLEANGFRLRSYPWDHSLHEKPTPSPLVLDVELPQMTIVINGPMYPYRVCSAACQMPDDTGPLWQGARLHISVMISAIQVNINRPQDPQPLPCARTDLRFVLNILLHKELFERESVEFSYSFKIREANVSGSAPRLQAAYQIFTSLLTNQPSLPLKHTTLARDALHDDDSVAIDVTVEEVSMRGYLTRHINTHILSVQSSRATAIHAADGEEMKQAWIFAAPEATTTTPFLRLAIQWCSSPVPNSLDYLGTWTETIAFAIDPLFIAWLAYKPIVKQYGDLSSSSTILYPKQSQFFVRRRTTTPSSSNRSRSGADMIHVHPRSAESSDPSEKKDERTFKNAHETMQPSRHRWTQDGENLLRLHERLRHMLVNVEMGLVLLYLTESTASAVDCASIRDAMDRYAADERASVLVISFGRLSMHSSSTAQHLWQEIRHDGPTFVTPSETKEEEVGDSFPWRLRVADMSCYTLEVRVPVERTSADKPSSVLRSQLKSTGVTPCTVVELITTTVTLSVVTKSMQFKTLHVPEKKIKPPEPTSKEARVKYFTGGIDFKPATLKEFVRGPAKRKKPTTAPEQKSQQPTSTHTISSGPVVSLGIHLHADTPPVIVRLNTEQVHVVATAIHCVQHMVKLLQRPPMTASNRSFTSLGGSHRSLIRSVSEVGEVRSSPSDETTSGSHSELISIYESKSIREIPPMKLKTFFWFQWVVSRATLVVATPRVKMAFEIDDIISTVDLQEHYNQLKVKLASASVRHYERTGSEEWKAGVLGGRVLEVREPNDAKEENHFLSITITQAQISNLPASWKEELHPKLLEQKTSTDTMWEVYATLAPLEAVLQPMIVEHLISLVHQFSPRSFCPLATEVEERSTSWQWPFCYLSAGGIRLLITAEDEKQGRDDTFMMIIGKITVNPHPDNPICRRPVSGEVGWSTAGAPFEGRQYEVLVKSVAVRSAKFSQLVYHESNEGVMNSALENPAVKWTQPVQTPIITPVLHSIDISCVLAPALYIGGLLACGPAVELNLMSDCAIELSIDQLSLLQDIVTDMQQSLLDSSRLMCTRFNTLEMCPYASFIMNQDVSEDLASLVSEATLVGPPPLPTMMKHSDQAAQNFMADSGVDTLTSKSSRNFDESAHVAKKSVSIAFVEQMAEASEYLEVFVTMGVIEVALYTLDDGSPEVVALRPPANIDNQFTVPQKPKEEVKYIASEKDTLSRDSRSITETIRQADVGTTKLEMNTLPHARSNEYNLPLLQVTLNQPNIYYWKKKQNKTLQISLFNAWVALGMGQTDGPVWNQVLLSTARGIPDPVTDIPPALATMKLIVPCSTSGSSGTTHPRGTVSVDIERPVQIEVCTDRVRRIKGVLGLIDQRVLDSSGEIDTPVVKLPFLYRFKRFMGKHTMESVTIQTSQISVCGSEGTVGWASASLQLASGLRPDRVVIRGLVTALLVAAGSPADRRHVLLQPLTFGVDAEATWEAWRRAEGGQSACEPTVRASVCLDRITMDLRPADLVTLRRIQHTVNEILDRKPDIPPSPAKSTDTLHQKNSSVNKSHTKFFDHRNSINSEHELSGHYYKDDLRSGAFKIVGGGQLPMAYQVMVHGNAVSWRYPHPRAITRIVVFPIPELEEELECVLELFSPMMNQWKPHTYFKLPVSEPREIKLYVSPPDVVFGVMWRFRECDEKNEQTQPFEFNINKFLPRHDPLLSDISPDAENRRGACRVSAEQLSGILRVDSYFAPPLLPHTRFVTQVSAIEINLHNSLPFISSQATALEGYYVSRPLMRSHRVLSLNARDVTVNSHMGSPAGTLTILDANFSADILDCATGAIEELVENFRVRGALSLPSDLSTMALKSRVRCRTTRVHVALHVPRLRTLHALAKDWKAVVYDYVNSSTVSSGEALQTNKLQPKRDLAAATAAALDGRVSLWIHNSCAVALRIGQEGTDEIVPLSPGARLAYRWRSPSATKRLRLAFAGPTADWRWSHSIPFTAGSTKVRLEDSESKNDDKAVPGAGVFVHVHVEEEGARRSMHLSGRLTLANMLRYNLLYKIRGRFLTSTQWRTVCSGEMAAESVGQSIICAAGNEIILKIKFVSHDTGWSGDIPLKECPKENVPWLVKIPSQGDVPYVSVWCRVVRARSDGRIIAAIWPLYVLYSNVPLDIDVMITSEATLSTADTSGIDTPPLIQTALGRGTSTHLLAPGTTATRHNLSFQYKNIECPVTREAVPMHYGVTDTSVFDKRPPVHNIDEVVEEILAWLRHSGRDETSDWPYSLVTHHWPGTWQAALLQPRCDVVVRYQAVRAGGGCSLEIQLCPVVLLCNAAPIALTLRAHDAAPLCKLEPGSAISPPSAILKKPFFMSVEMGRETFVSGQLEITNSEPGRYSAPPPGKLAFDHSADFVIQCNHKVAMLTMYYEIKENINVLGISSTYTIVNRLDVDIVVSAIAVPDGETNIQLQPKAFKVISPTEPGSVHGVPLCRFWLRSRWRGSCPTELNTYLCVAIPSAGVGVAGAFPAHSPVPVRLGGANVTARRPIALTDAHGKSMAAVVTQQKQDGRWLIAIAPDPCPQFLVYNRTHLSLALAQPVLYADEPSTSYISVVPDVEGIRWWCIVQPQTLTHYSSPAHCARYPPPANLTPPAIPFLTIGTIREDNEPNIEPNWCPSVAAADGEQLLQLYGGITIKLRVRTHPHSTLIELQDVDQNDISASDIRRRLVGALPTGEIPVSQDSVPNLIDVGVHYQTVEKLTRTDAQVKLLPSDVMSMESGTSHLSELAPLLPQDETASVVMQIPIDNSSDQLGIIMDKDREANDDDDDSQSRELRVEGASINKVADLAASEASIGFQDVSPTGWVNGDSWPQLERVRCVLDSLAVEMATSADARPLIILHADRVALHVISDQKRVKTTLSVSDVQVDNLQYESGQYDFAVVASTRSWREERDRWPAFWNMFAERDAFASMRHDARLLVVVQYDKWAVVDYEYTELTEVEISLGPLALYIEDAYVSALAELWRRAMTTAQASEAAAALADEHVLRCPLRLRTLHVHPLDLTLTLHTAVRMYIALDQSPLRLTAFRVQDMMTSPERLTHAVTVHYLSAAILGAGWVVGGLELLGAPGALAARVGGATGGVRGIASAAAAALLRSLSAWAGSLARNLDLLAGDEEHARRAAAARRRPPPSLLAGLVTGITNFAINILGAVGGLAHHPLVGVAVGETESGTAALRRGLLGALTKPLSATADLVAYAGHGLLSQTGWDPIPQPRALPPSQDESGARVGWKRDCVRWTFRLADLTAVAGFEVLLDNAPLQMLLTHKFLVVADPESERIVEMIDFRYCTIGPYQGPIIELCVTQRQASKVSESRVIDEDDEYQMSAAAMARVARYTGAEGGPGSSTVAEVRTLHLLSAPGRSYALHAALAAAIHHNADTHFSML